MAEKPIIAAKKPAKADLKAGEKYFCGVCGRWAGQEEENEHEEYVPMGRYGVQIHTTPPRASDLSRSFRRM